ncbi:hypothetical protein CLAFUW4_11443 [Fulvia fulva]|uniref:Uncharacterized protein n=1 Tax=Passalora fulva TaxID=5499 RepID=A0A9Q8PC16_PASFU|nr:uncharacterized protein CLAFUR5_10483 [Fulvia fulva]KAK4619798.1 hypothetical protein CLAFUR4_11449 [Fulvia fulva]KAK4621052.1 hypothetical protein CLAFUR0_11455 [Fulvia fulva]UJO19666.1 hypothetical protein CLAFUR5_10483 [Fulvia fulva]WPV17226.1 hypothetical protein CLAFUW4_11443 [Fulvia fulva]WPV32387.1 hypothetical protein CLAFUW7_11439 [Fulvia fulva]
MKLFTTLLAATFAALALAKCDTDPLCTGVSHEACHFHCITRGSPFGVCTIQEGCPSTSSICDCSATTIVEKRDDTPLTTDLNGDGQLDDMDKILAILANCPVISEDEDDDDTNDTDTEGLEKRKCHSVKVCWGVG